MSVRPRPTPAEGADETIHVELDEALTVFAATIEDWVAPRQTWELQLREGHDSGRANNVEARVAFVAGEQTSRRSSSGSTSSTPPTTSATGSCSASTSGTGSRRSSG